MVILEENEAVYDKIKPEKTEKKYSISNFDLKTLIDLLEKQQKINSVILKKLKGLEL